MTSGPRLSSACEIAAQIRRKEVSPVEVARAHLDRIERLNSKLNAFVDYQPEAVLAQAREAETDDSAWRRTWAAAWRAAFYQVFD